MKNHTSIFTKKKKKQIACILKNKSWEVKFFQIKCFLKSKLNNYQFIIFKLDKIRS